MGVPDFEGLLRASMGLNGASVGLSAIERAVQERLAACKLADPAAYWECLCQSAAERQRLIDAVVVSETWFFRDRGAFAALAGLAHDELLRRPDAVLGLLSLPCSTGEEPYSMAMALLDAAIPGARFRVDAVDISTRALALAGRAEYGKNSFRDHEVAFRDRHFEPTRRGYHLREAVRRHVRFQWGNLFDAEFLPGVEQYDFIFCRNVLIYFDRATQDRALVVLKRLLKATGALFVAPAETGVLPAHGFVSTNLPLAFAFRQGLTGRREPRQVVEPVKSSSLRRLNTAEAPAHRAVRSASVTPAAGPPTARVTGTAADLDEATRLADEGHFVEAATCCVAYLDVHGPSAAAFCLMGLVRDATGNQSEAMGYYKKALYLEPNHHASQIHLALLMEKQGDMAGAQVLRNRTRRLEQQHKAAGA